MKLDIEFIKKLAERRFGEVGEIIRELGFLKIEEHIIQNLNTEYKRIEQIAYTADYLIDNSLVTNPSTGIGSNVPSFNPSNFEIAEYPSERLQYVHSLLQQYWGKELRVATKFFEFVDNGYKTTEEIEKRRSFWLPILVAILASFLTALFTPIAENLLNGSDTAHHRKHHGEDGRWRR